MGPVGGAARAARKAWNCCCSSGLGDGGGGGCAGYKYWCGGMYWLGYANGGICGGIQGGGHMDPCAGYDVGGLGEAVVVAPTVLVIAGLPA